MDTATHGGMRCAWHAARGWGLLATASALGSALITLLIPAAAGAAVREVATDHHAGSAVVRLGAYLAGAALLATLASLASGCYAAAVTAHIRTQLATRVVPSPSDTPTSDLVTRLLIDARQSASLLSTALGVSVAAASLITGLVMIGLIDWWLLLGIAVVLLLLPRLLQRFVSDTTALIAGYRAGQAELGQRLLDAQDGAASIRAHGTWRRELARVTAPLAEVRAAGAALWTAQRRFAWRTGLVAPTLQLVTITVGSLSLMRGRIDLGSLTTAIGYSVVVLGALDGIESVAGLNLVRAASARLDPLLRRAALRPASTAMPAGPAEIVIDDVSITDETGDTVRTVSARIPAGACAAITGPGGSMLARVLAGVATQHSGEIRVDGRVRPPGNADGAVSLATADPPLLGHTVAGLIGLGSTAPDGELLRRAAERAHILHVVESLPNGFDTPLRDLELSGGELQRLGIAQALARDSRVLVLDGATVSLDAATEREVVGALLGIRDERTVIVVSDRPGVVRRADILIDLGESQAAHPAVTR